MIFFCEFLPFDISECVRHLVYFTYLKKKRFDFHNNCCYFSIFHRSARSWHHLQDGGLSFICNAKLYAAGFLFLIIVCIFCVP